jgi:hypothetical protein
VLASRFFSLDSSLAPGEILARIASRTRAVSPRYAWTLASIDASIEPSGSLDLFVGQVTDVGFRVARATYGRGVGPIISGSVGAAGSNTTVTVHVRYDLFATLALGVLVTLPIVGALLLAQGFPPIPLVPVAVVVAGGVLLASHLVVVHAAQRFQGTLRHLLGGVGGA